MGNVVPMDSKLLSNYWYMSWPSWPTHISKLCSHKIRAEPPPPPPPLRVYHRRGKANLWQLHHQELDSEESLKRKSVKVRQHSKILKIVNDT